MPESVPIVENASEVPFLFVHFHDAGLYPAGLLNQVLHQRGLSLNDGGSLLFQKVEHAPVVDNAVFDDFGQSVLKVSVGKGLQE